MPAPTAASVAAEFEARFGEPPAVIVRAPGRVNLIGEHTDYAGLPVLPIAIDRAIHVAAGHGPTGMVEAQSATIAGAAALPRENPSAAVTAPWQRYLAGALLQLARADDEAQPGARLFIDGDLPLWGGLSSSSALTLGVLASLAQIWGISLEPDELVRRAILAERHVGVESGGMDQEAIVFARAGAALRIEFDPPGREFVRLPVGLALVAASSGEEAPKGGSARAGYNERVIGSRIAAVMLADQVGVDAGTPPRLSDVAGIDVVDVLVDELPERMSAQEAAHGAAVDVERIVRLTAGRFDSREKVPVKRPARHILAEAERVGFAAESLRAGNLIAFGALLNDSHKSLREDMRCSTPALDSLCAAMRAAGAFGARLTGAGFGGFAIAAVAPAGVDAVVAAALAATGGPAFPVAASAGLEVVVS
ncbi:MAG: galactokinase [Tepidiformaceae bacterium]